VIEAGGEGTDQVFANTDYTLGAFTFVETLSTTSTLGLANLNLTGNGLNNSVIGNAGSNAIKGMVGNDTLFGGGGADAFVFNTALNSATNVDTILDFSVADDEVVLASWIFTALAPGALSAGAFATGAAAAEADDRIVYNGATGALYYDADGIGGAAQIQFGAMASGLALTNLDFVVV
jgi:Ca2+-binding RTX toxin-like protein